MREEVADSYSTLRLLPPHALSGARSLNTCNSGTNRAKKSVQLTKCLKFCKEQFAICQFFDISIRKKVMFTFLKHPLIFIYIFYFPGSTSSTTSLTSSVTSQYQYNSYPQYAMYTSANPANYYQQVTANLRAGTTAFPYSLTTPSYYGRSNE